MTYLEFNAGMLRLKNTYEAKYYPPERVKVLWHEIQGFSSQWFMHVVDEFIGSMRQAPLLNEFREAMSKEREKVAYKDKMQHSQDAHDFFNATYQDDDIAEICTNIRKIIRGVSSPKETEQYIQLLQHAADNNRPPVTRSAHNATGKAGL